MVDPLSRHLFPCYKFNLQRQFVNMHATGTGARGAARHDDEGWQRVCLPGLPHTQYEYVLSVSPSLSCCLCSCFSCCAAFVLFTAFNTLVCVAFIVVAVVVVVANLNK